MSESTVTSARQVEFAAACLRRLAIPQVLLAALAITNFHVQIITRIASGYPVPYLWLAAIILQWQSPETSGKSYMIGQISVRWMVIYALVQAVLFGNFLPPA